MNSHERLLTVAARLDEIAADTENDELVALSNDLAIIADVGGFTCESKSEEKPPTELERQIVHMIRQAAKTMLFEEMYSGRPQNTAATFPRQAVTWDSKSFGLPDLLQNGDTVSFKGPDLVVTEV